MAGVLERGLGRRNFIKAAMATSALGVGASVASCSGDHAGAAPTESRGASNTPGFGGTVLQPGVGDIPGTHYVESTPDSILWGYVPSVHDEPVMRMKSGETVTMDLVSHEGILEDQGRDPVSYFGDKGIDEKGVLQDAIDIAAEYSRTERDFKVDGPHVVTGPVFVEGALPGDVLKIEPIANDLRVPYGVVSSRHGKGGAGGDVRRWCPRRDRGGRSDAGPGRRKAKRRRSHGPGQRLRVHTRRRWARSHGQRPGDGAVPAAAVRRDDGRGVFGRGVTD